MKPRKKQNPKSKLLFRKWIIEGKFNPYEPSDELEEELYEWTIPSANYIKKDCRGVSIGAMNEDLASYIAFEAVMGRPEIRLLAGIRYYILMARDIDVTRKDLYEMITDDEVGIMSPIHAEHLKVSDD